MATLAELAQKMMERGIDIPTIAEILEVEESDLQTLRDELNINVDREDVISALNRLTHEAYLEAMRLLHEGSPSVRMALIRMLLMMIRPSMGKQNPKEMASLIEEFKASIEMADEQEDDEDEPDEDIGFDEETPSDAAN